MRRREWPLLAATLLAACQRPGTAPGPTPAAQVPRPTSPLEQAKAALAAGDADGALAKLEQATPDADTLYWQGMAWMKKAETAPLPTPAPLTSPLPKGAEPPAAPEFKPEELKAIEAFEQSLSARSEQLPANMALAQLLAPHALRRYEGDAARRPRTAGRRTVANEPAAGGPDFSPDRVIRAYKAALQADPKAKPPAEELARFAQRIGRLDVAELALQELCRRDQERPDPFIRYGDFLVNDKKAPEAAIEQYQQALVWAPGDEATRAKIADIYIAMGIGHWKAQEYALAEARLQQAQKFVTDRNSPQGLKIQDYMNKLGTIRRR